MGSSSSGPHADTNISASLSGNPGPNCWRTRYPTADCIRKPVIPTSSTPSTYPHTDNLLKASGATVVSSPSSEGLPLGDLPWSVGGPDAAGRGSALSGFSSTVPEAFEASCGASMAGMRSTSPAMILRASAWAWRSASSCSRSVPLCALSSDMSASRPRGADASAPSSFTVSATVSR
jgi:hypothetical protein